MHRSMGVGLLGHGVIFPAYQVVVMPECFIKTIPADGLELTHSTSVPGFPKTPNM